MEQYICIDIGREKISYALVSEELDITEKDNEYIGINSKEELFDPIRSVVDKFRDVATGVSITMPGVIDREKGIAHSGGVFRWVKDMDYAAELSEYVGLPVVICNDAKAACMAEMGYGALKKVRNGVMLMILSTGIGGAVVVDGNLLNGEHFAAGEFSYMRGDYKARDGYQDMFALSSSMDGLNSAVQGVTGKKLNLLRIMSKVVAGDEAVRKGVEEFCERLAIYIYNIQCVVDADVFVISGEMTEEPRMMEMIKKAVDDKFDADIYKNIFKPEIRSSVFHNNSRKYGAVYNFRQLTGRLENK